MKKILVPSDFSKCAGNALVFALEIARRTGAEITVLNVSRPYEGIDNNMYNALWIDDYLAKKQTALALWVQKYGSTKAFKNVNVQVEGRTGFAADEVSDMAEKGHFDLVVMGTTGATGLKELFLGSVASSVIARTKLPVLAVPKNGSFKRLGKMVFATDFKAHLSVRSVRTLQHFLALENARLDIVHVFEKSTEKPNLKQETALREQLDRAEMTFYYLQDQNVPRAVSAFVKKFGAHLLCTVSHEHGLIHRLFIQSISKNFAHHSKLPLLVLHD